MRGTSLGLLAALGCAFTMITATAAPAASYSVSAWGENHFGELGDGNHTTTDLPVATGAFDGVESVSGGGKFALALLGDGTVMGWGANGFGQLCTSAAGGGLPVPMSGVSEATEIAAGSSHALVLLKNGTVLACGENNLGQLGIGTIGHGGPEPRPVSGLGDVAAISAHGDTSFALLENGTVMAWGDNHGGQLGDGGTTNSDLPVPVSGLSDVAAVAAGDRFALALLENGTVMAWGMNTQDQLGTGSSERDSLTPVPVSGLHEVSAISAGRDGAMALLKNGTVMAWGLNRSGGLGNGTTTASDVPVPVKSLTGVTKIAAGGEYNLALLGDGTVMGWGQNNYGQLGDGTIRSTDVPEPVRGLGEVAGIAAGGGFAVAYGAQAPTLAGPTIADAHGVSSTSGGATVHITGTGFAEVAEVRFGSEPASSFRVNSATSITAVAPPHEAGKVDVSVTTAAAVTTVSQFDQFVYVPTIAKLQADSGPPAGGTKVTVTGSGFAVGATSTRFFFGETQAGAVDCVSATVCTVMAPAHAPGAVPIHAWVNGVHSRFEGTNRYTYT